MAIEGLPENQEVSTPIGTKERDDERRREQRRREQEEEVERHRRELDEERELHNRRTAGEVRERDEHDNG